MTGSASNSPENTRNVTNVPTAGMVTKVGRNVPRIEPTVLQADSRPTTDALSSSESVANLLSAGVTVPSRNSGGTKMTIQQTNAAIVRKFVDTVTMSAPETSITMYLPTSGISAIHTAATSTRMYMRSGSGSRSAHLPPNTAPNASAIMIVPMMIVHTICELEKYGASRRWAPSSAAMTAMPETNSVTYRNTFDARIGRFTPSAPLTSMRLLPLCAQRASIARRGKYIYIRYGGLHSTQHALRKPTHNPRSGHGTGTDGAHTHAHLRGIRGRRVLPRAD